jgi:hypothetical protein
LMNALYRAEHGGNDAHPFVRQASEEPRSLSELVKRLLRPGDMQYWPPKSPSRSNSQDSETF